MPYTVTSLSQTAFSAASLTHHTPAISHSHFSPTLWVCLFSVFSSLPILSLLTCSALAHHKCKVSELKAVLKGHVKEWHIYTALLPLSLPFLGLEPYIFNHHTVFTNPKAENFLNCSFTFITHKPPFVTHKPHHPLQETETGEEKYKDTQLKPFPAPHFKCFSTKRYCFTPSSERIRNLHGAPCSALLDQTAQGLLHLINDSRRESKHNSFY